MTRASKFLSKAKNVVRGIGPLGVILNVATIAAAYSEMEETIKQNPSKEAEAYNKFKKTVVGVIGGTIGGAGGALLGTMIGGPFGAIALGTVGYFFGEAIAEKAFNYFAEGNVAEGPKPGDAERADTSQAAITGRNVAEGPKPGDAERATHMSQAAKLISDKEGFREKAYYDAGKYSVGFGHQITQQERSAGKIDLGGEGKDIMIPRGTIGYTQTKVTREQAQALLEKDLPKYEELAKKPLGDSWNKLNDNQKAALISYAYNTGSTDSLVKKGLKTAIDSGDVDAAAKIIAEKGIATSRGKPVEGLKKRRAEEAKLFATPMQAQEGDALAKVSADAAAAAAAPPPAPTPPQVAVAQPSPPPPAQSIPYISGKGFPARNPDPTMMRVLGGIEYSTGYMSP